MGCLYHNQYILLAGICGILHNIHYIFIIRFGDLSISRVAKTQKTKEAKII
jgi:hypothetical protein